MATTNFGTSYFTGGWVSIFGLNKLPILMQQEQGLSDLTAPFF